MIECLAIEQDDIECASLVIRVTGPAVGRQCLVIATMKASRRLPIRRHRLMAGKTEPGLRRTGEGFVAGAAVLFQLRVPAYERSWHDKLLKQALRVCHHCQHHQQDLRTQYNEESVRAHRATSANRGGRQRRAQWRPVSAGRTAAYAGHA